MTELNSLLVTSDADKCLGSTYGLYWNCYNDYTLMPDSGPQGSATIDVTANPVSVTRSEAPWSNLDRCVCVDRMN